MLTLQRPSPAVHSFPLPLACPSCGEALMSAQPCACAAATRVEGWQGIPRLLFGQQYWGECSSEKMARILARMDEIHWRAALEEVVPNEPLQRHLCNPIGADFVHGMPWGEIDKVLEI